MENLIAELCFQKKSQKLMELVSKGIWKTPPEMSLLICTFSFETPQL